MTSTALDRSYVTLLPMADRTFGAILTAVLAEKGVSASELGRRLGHRDPRQVRRWKNSHHAPQNYDTVKSIARALGVPVSRFDDDPDSDAEAGLDAVDEGP